MSAPATPPDWDAIARYLAGESPADESAIVREWLDSNPADRALVERLEAAVIAEQPAQVDVEAALALVHQRMNAPTLTVHRGQKSSRRVFSIAAVASMAAAAAAIFFVSNRPSSNSAVPAAAGARTYATGVGQRDSVVLTDGSRVILGPRTTLVVPATYASARTVEVTGDAYFDVRHDAAKPFTVRAANALIEDIGTTFTVESDAANQTSVAVVSGSVRLRAQTSEASSGVLLAAGDRGSLDATGSTHVEHHAVRDEDTSWIEGRLAFRDASLARVASEIERWYGVRVRFSDSTMESRHVTMSFAGEPAEQVLRIIELSIGAHLERRGDTAIFSPNRGPAAPR